MAMEFSSTSVLSNAIMLANADSLAEVHNLSTVHTLSTTKLVTYNVVETSSQAKSSHGAFATPTMPRVTSRTTVQVLSSSPILPFTQLVTGKSEVKSQSGKTAGIIAGCVIGAVILVILVVILVLFLVKRRKVQKRRNFSRVENPIYKTKNADDEFQFNRGAPEVRPMLADVKTSDSATSSLERKKKRPAPLAPAVKDDRKKRAAPAPPPPFASPVDGGNFYERESRGSFENINLAAYAAKNDSAAQNDLAEEGHMPNKVDDGAVVLNEKTLESPNLSTFGRRPKTKSQKSLDNLSLDEYDKTKNPFFA